MATLEQIQTRMKKLQAQAEALIAKRAQAALDQIRELMLKHGFTTQDIEASAKARRNAARDVARVPAKNKVKRATAKGILPPKYRDPVTGATWSGKARPPAWIKDVKDRSIFLIDGASTRTAMASPGRKKPVAKKIAEKKKTITKKAITKKITAKKAPLKKAAKKTHSAQANGSSTSV